MSDSDRCDEDGCQALQQRDKEVELVRPWPAVLAIHLKRWHVVSMVPFIQRKIPTAIDFEIILPVAADEPPYQLRAVVAHSGHAGGGHYTALVRSVDNHWCLCDDWRVPERVGIERLRSASVAREAYMLVFER